LKAPAIQEIMKIFIKNGGDAVVMANSVSVILIDECGMCGLNGFL